MVKQFDEISMDTVLVIKCRLNRLNVTVAVGKRAKNLLRNVRKDYQKLTRICCVLVFTDSVHQRMACRGLGLALVPAARIGLVPADKVQSHA